MEPDKLNLTDKSIVDKILFMNSKNHRKQEELIEKYNTLRKKIFYNTFIVKEIERYYSGLEDRNCLLLEIGNFYDNWDKSPDTYSNNKYFELLSELRDVSSIPKIIKNDELNLLQKRNRQLENEINQKVKKEIISDEKSFVRKTLKILPFVFIFGGFIRASLYSQMLSISPSILFGLEDYWALGVSAFAAVFPLSIMLIVFVPLGILISSKTSNVSHEIQEFKNDVYKPKDKILLGIALVFLFSFPLVIVYLIREDLSWNETILSLIFIYTLLAYRLLPHHLVENFHLMIPIVFIVYVSLGTYFEINYALKNRIDSGHYQFQGNTEVPQQYDYVLSTSNYHVFNDGESSILLPVLDVSMIKVIDKNQTQNPSESILLEGIEKKFINTFFHDLR